MANELTPAEQAAAEALAPTIGGEYDPYEIAEMARAVVAAARPIIEAEVFERWRSERRQTFLVSYQLQPTATKMGFGATDVSFTGPLTVSMVEEIRQGISEATSTPLDCVVILSMVELDEAEPDARAAERQAEGEGAS